VIRTTLTPADAFLERDGLTYKHLALEAARGNVLPLVMIGTDIFVTETDAERFRGRLHIRAINAASGIDSGEVR
jgi:hypothetical protein